MKIAVVVGSLQGGGAERVASFLAEQFALAGSEVTLITFDRAERDFYCLAPAVRREALDLHDPSPPGLRRIVAITRRVHRLRAAIWKADPDVVVSLLDYVNVLTLIATLGMPVPAIVCEHTDAANAPLPGLRQLVRRISYRRAAAIVVLTERSRSWAERAVPGVRSVVLPNPVSPPPEIAAGHFDLPSPYIVSMGRLVPSKGFDDLVAAFALGAPDTWSLVIVGDGPERASIEHLAREHGLKDRVLLVGAVVDPWPILSGAALFALASRQEGLPNAIIEAMAVGLPVVSYDCPTGPAELIDDGRNGVLVPLGDTAGLAAAISTLTSSAERRLEMGAAALRRSHDFAPDQILPQWWRLFGEVTL